MNPKIYACKSVDTNFIEALITPLVNFNDRWLTTCLPVLNKDGKFHFDYEEPYVKELSDVHYNKPGTADFRRTTYKNKIEKVKKLLEDNKKNIWLCNEDTKEIDFLKEQLGDDVITLSINYNMKSFEKVYNNYHFTPQSKGPPISYQHKADYVIDVEDIFNPKKLIPFLEKIDGPRNEKQLEFYNKWYVKNTQS